LPKDHTVLTRPKIKRAVFLDRDGTIIKEVSYLRRLKDLRLLPGAGRAIGLLKDSGFKIVVVTNQSGIARGYFDEEFLNKVHKEIQKRLKKKSAAVDAWYFCPHHPSQGKRPFRRHCVCRKPEIGMIEKAAKDLNIDITGSFMIGDSLRDLETGWNAGMRSILVMTGYGKETLSIMEPAKRRRISFVAKDLMEASKWIVENCHHLLPPYL